MSATSSATKATKKTSDKVFEAAYSKLNPGQKQAVDTIEGPVMVVAGPGTGKTQVVALRVANILKQTQMRPSNILCLTFSVSGATAMRERLRSLIGPDAYSVTVKNYHTFCNDLIAEHPILFEEWSALEQISDVERYRAINTIIDELMPDLALVSKKNPYRRTRDILSRISLLKREGKADMKHLEQVAKEFRAELSEKSKTGTKAHERNLLTAQKFEEFLSIFERYQAMLKETQRYDYDDMILYVLEALKNEDWLRASLQERYQYILVDEFQDTNGSQYELIEQLTTYDNLDFEPNLFVVGDDDQAIYRFQGASLQNILGFTERFSSAPVIALTQSYRCSQPILDAAGSVIENNMERLTERIDVLDKNLTAAATEATDSPTLLFSPSDTTEPWLIADLIKEKINSGIEPENIAVLVQKNAELEPLYDVLTAREIPVQMSGKVDLLAHPLVLQALAILRCISNPRDNALLGAALGCSCFTIHPADLGRLFNAVRIAGTPDCLLELLLELDNKDRQLDVTLNSPEAVIAARDVLLELEQSLPTRTVIDTLEHVLKQTGLMPKADEKNTDFNPVDYAALQEFFEHVKYRAYEQPSFSLRQLLGDLEYYQSPEYGELRLSYDLPHLTESGVQLMTAHQSKGLEFAVVILAHFRHGHWDAKRAPASLTIPEKLLFGWENATLKEQRLEDERRVAYVAMTRAKESLIFTCPKQLSIGDRMRDVSPSGFFAEAGELPEQLQELKDPEHVSTLQFTPVLKVDEAFTAFLKERLETFALSVTALNHFLEDPQLFLEIDLLQIPQAKQPSMVYGNAVHDAMRRWALGVQTGKSLDEKGLLTSFHQYLDERELLTDGEKARLKKLGDESLPRYYQQQLEGKEPIVHWVERKIVTSLGEVPIKGTIDRLDLDAPESAVCKVIDYKTGRPQSENAIREGDYFRQLAFYSLLLENGAAILKPQYYILDFIGEGSEHPVERVFEVTEAEKKELGEVVEAVWQKITNLDFTAL